MKKLKPYLPRSLTTSRSIEWIFFFMNKLRKQRQEYKPATISNFQHRIVQNEKKRRTVIGRDEEDWLYDCFFISCEWFSQEPTSTFFHPKFAMRMLNYSSRIDRNHFLNFNKLQLLRLVTNSVTNRSWSLVYIQHDLRALNLFSKLNSW